MSVEQHRNFDSFLDVLDNDELRASVIMQYESRSAQRGDGLAIYVNEDMSHPELGDQKVVTWGSNEALLEGHETWATLPAQLPDTASSVNWRYCLRHVYRPIDAELVAGLRGFASRHADKLTPEERGLFAEAATKAQHYAMLRITYRSDGTKVVGA